MSTQTDTKTRVTTTIDGERIHLYQLIRLPATDGRPAGSDRVVVALHEESIETATLAFEFREEHERLPGEPVTSADGSPVFGY